MPNMLALDSSRWLELQSHFGNGGIVPELIRRWLAAVGTSSEEETYQELFEHYLHQCTSISCAYAVVPWVMSVVPGSSPALKLEYLIDVARVEMARRSPSEVDAAIERVRRNSQLPEELREHFVKATRERLPVLAPDLADEYHRAVEQAKNEAVSTTASLLRAEGRGD